MSKEKCRDIYHKCNSNPTYNSWAKRPLCLEATNRRYGTNSTVCERWKDYKNFVADMGPRPEGKILCRLDIFDGDSPANCYWGTNSDAKISNRLNYVDYMIGKEFPNWDVLSFTRRHNGNRMYMVRCKKCSRECELQGAKIRRGGKCVCSLPYGYLCGR